jgi:hypothetical protein
MRFVNFPDRCRSGDNGHEVRYHIPQYRIPQCI